MMSTGPIQCNSLLPRASSSFCLAVVRCSWCVTRWALVNGLSAGCTVPVNAHSFLCFKRPRLVMVK